MIVVSVGSFQQGFDGLITAMDAACARHGFPAFAQTGHSSVTPEHMQWQRFLSRPAMLEKLSQASLIVCHGGLGILGDAMRAGKPILAVPRQQANTPFHPINNQTQLVQRLQKHYGIKACLDLDELESQLCTLMQDELAPKPYPLGTNIPQLIEAFLRT